MIAIASKVKQQAQNAANEAINMRRQVASLPNILSHIQMTVLIKVPMMHNPN